MSEKQFGRKSKLISITALEPSESVEIPDASTSWWSGLSQNGKWLALAIMALLSIGALGAGLKFLDDDARLQKKLAVKDRSLLSSVNPFVPTLPEPTPQLSKEYLYAGQKLLVVEDKNATAAAPADLAVWRPSNGTWYIFDGSWITQSWGASTDVPVPGDFDGDGKTDFSVFRPGTSTWYVVFSSTQTSGDYAFGASGDLVSPADFDGDGKTDEAIFRPTTGVWHIHGSTVGYYTHTWGVNGDLPASADFDGDGKADLAVFRPTDRKFYSINSADSSLQTADTGISSGTYEWKTVSGDYDGDGIDDYAVYDKDTATWYVRSSISGAFGSTDWGDNEDLPVQNDYDNDGKVDYAVWTPSGTYVGRWYIRKSSDPGNPRTQTWGVAADVPVPAFYRR